MATKFGTAARATWELAARQHWVVTRPQLLGLGFTTSAIRHRLATGRLHRVYAGVYALGRPELTREGWWMAAVLTCGPGALLSHISAAVLWALLDADDTQPHVTVPRANRHRRKRITVHSRRPDALAGATTRAGIPVTSPVRTIVDLAAASNKRDIEALINRADKLDLVGPGALRDALDGMNGEPGVPMLRSVLDVATYAVTDSELERRFLPIARRAGLPKPRTQAQVNGFRVDFHWPDLGLIVETDGLRYHRTPTQQARDTVRDNAHRAAGLTPLRFTHAQVCYEPAYVERVLRAVTLNLRRA